MKDGQLIGTRETCCGPVVTKGAQKGVSGSNMEGTAGVYEATYLKLFSRRGESHLQNTRVNYTTANFITFLL